MATHQPIDLSESATPAQAAFDRALRKLVANDESRTARVEYERFSVGWPDFLRWKLEKDIKKEQQRCLRVDELVCIRKRGLHVVPKRREKKWEEDPEWWEEERAAGYDMDEDCTVVGGDGYERRICSHEPKCPQA